MLLALGLFTRPIAVLVVGFMAVSAYYVHAANGFLWIKGGFEYPLFWGLWRWRSRSGEAVRSRWTPT